MSRIQHCACQCWKWSNFILPEKSNNERTQYKW